MPWHADRFLCAGRCQILWDHPAPKSWFKEGSSFTGTPVRVPVAAQPVVACQRQKIARAGNRTAHRPLMP
jgi:hypothetical protein